MNGKKAVTYTRYKKKEKKTNNRKNNKRVLLAKKMYVAQCLYIKLYVSKPIVANIKKKTSKKNVLYRTMHIRYTYVYVYCVDSRPKGK